MFDRKIDITENTTTTLWEKVFFLDVILYTKELKGDTNDKYLFELIIIIYIEVKKKKYKMMHFSKYDKITSYLTKHSVTTEVENEQWIVTEKVHGANFSFHVTADEIKLARRRDFLKEGENFFGYRDAKFMKTHHEQIRAVHEHVMKQYPDEEINKVTIWGELFGGKNSHQVKIVIVT